MKKFLVFFFIFTLNISTQEEDTTIVCVLDGEATQAPDEIREIKLQVLITFNEKSVVSFKKQFLTDDDFNEGHIWSKGMGINAIDIDGSVSSDEISISISNNDQFKDGNLNLVWLDWDLDINRKSGLAKATSSYAYTIHDMDNEENKTWYRIRYSSFGNCSKSANKF